MYRRRLAAFAGAIGLLGALFSSAVAARADTVVTIDSTMSSLISTYLNSSQDACVGGTSTYDSLAGTKSCMINETSTGHKNIAVCVQSNSPGTSQECTITQTNDSSNNYALVFQHVIDNGGPTEDATQKSTITQNMSTLGTGTGSNFAEIIQIVKQSTKQAGDQSQTVHQLNTTDQTSTTGTNFASLSESSDQSGQSDTAKQTQFSDQEASDPNGHINQTSAGLSQVFVTQSQVQNLTGSGPQMQTIDPRCCSIQQSNVNDEFNIQQFTSQANNQQPSSSQDATSVAQCATTGKCTTSSTTNQNGATTTVTCGPTSSCTAVVVCHNGTCPETCVSSDCFVPQPPCFTSCDAAVATASFLNKELAIAPRSQTRPSARSAPSGALLT